MEAENWHFHQTFQELQGHDPYLRNTDLELKKKNLHVGITAGIY